MKKDEKAAAWRISSGLRDWQCFVLIKGEKWLLKAGEERHKSSTVYLMNYINTKNTCGIHYLINYLTVYTVIKTALLALRFYHIIKASRGSASVPREIARLMRSPNIWRSNWRKNLKAELIKTSFYVNAESHRCIMWGRNMFLSNVISVTCPQRKEDIYFLLFDYQAWAQSLSLIQRDMNNSTRLSIHSELISK